MLFFIPFADPFLSFCVVFPYLLVHVVPNVCLLSHVNVFLSRLCFFVPVTFVNVLSCFVPDRRCFF